MWAVRPSGSKARGSSIASCRIPAAVTRASVWWSLGSKRSRAGGEPRPSSAPAAPKQTVEAPVANFRATVLQFLDVWGVYATNQCLGGYCNGVKVYVNGKLAPAGLNTKPKEHDAVTVVAPTQEQLGKVFFGASRCDRRGSSRQP